MYATDVKILTAHLPEPQFLSPKMRAKDDSRDLPPVKNGLKLNKTI
jgi:hypothetical protein